MSDNPIITKEELEEFKEIARKKYGVELTDEQAFEQVSALLNLFEHVIKKKVEEKRRKNA